MAELVSACRGKIRYRTKGAARDAAKRSRAAFADGSRMRAYECPDGCGGFHLTSMSTTDFRRMKFHKRRRAV